MAREKAKPKDLQANFVVSRVSGLAIYMNSASVIYVTWYTRYSKLNYSRLEYLCQLI
jgi:hypothetical protein